MAEPKETTTPETDADSKRRGRSPSYPGINLEQALGRIKEVYEAEGRHEAPESTIMADLGYAAKSGQGLVVLAALKSFGLLEVNKETGRLKVSQRGIKILLDSREDGTERLSLLQDAALAPPIHDAMLKQYGGQLPSDANLLYHLRVDRGFTDTGASQFIKLYKETMEFAKLLGGDTLSSGKSDKPSWEVQSPMVVNPTSQILEIPIPIPGANWPSLRAAFPMTEEAWEEMLEVLKAMKPGLVKKKPRPEPSDDADNLD